MAARAWHGSSVEMRGDKEVVAKMRAFAQRMPAIAGEALHEEGEIELLEAARRAPLDVDPPAGRRGGELRASGRALGPTLADDAIEVTLAFGGENVGVPYAVRQHQGYYRHDVGQREYLESTVREAQKHLAARLVRRLEARLGGLA